MAGDKVFEITQEEFSVFTRRLTQLKQYDRIDKTGKFVNEAREDVDSNISRLKQTLSDSNMLTGRQEYEGEVRIASVTEAELKEALYKVIGTMEANSNEPYDAQLKAEFDIFATAFNKLEKNVEKSTAITEKGDLTMSHEQNSKKVQEQSFQLTDQQLQKFLTNAAFIRLKHAKEGQEGERFDFSQKENAKFVHASLAYLNKQPDVNLQPEKDDKARTYTETELKAKLYDTVRYAVAIRKKSLDSEKPGLESMAAKQAAQQIVAKQNQPSKVAQLEQRRGREQAQALGR